MGSCETAWEIVSVSLRISSETLIVRVLLWIVAVCDTLSENSALRVRNVAVEDFEIDTEAVGDSVPTDAVTLTVKLREDSAVRLFDVERVSVELSSFEIVAVDVRTADLEEEPLLVAETEFGVVLENETLVEAVRDSLCSLEDVNAVSVVESDIGSDKLSDTDNDMEIVSIVVTEKLPELVRENDWKTLGVARDIESDDDRERLGEGERLRELESTGDLEKLSVTRVLDFEIEYEALQETVKVASFDKLELVVKDTTRVAEATGVRDLRR